MDADRFLGALSALFDDFPRSEHPRDRRFQPVLTEVENLAAEVLDKSADLAVTALDGLIEGQKGKALPPSGPC